MKSTGQSVKLGLLVCKHCGRWIDEVETEKVTVLYGVCRDEACRNETDREESEHE